MHDILGYQTNVVNVKWRQIILSVILIAAGCQQGRDVAGPDSSAKSSSIARGSIVYTLSVPKGILGVLDSLNVTVTAFNRSAKPVRLTIGQHFNAWAIINSRGKTVMSGPKVISNLIYSVTIDTHKSAVIHRMSIGYLGARLDPGFYTLTWNLSGFSLKLAFMANKRGQVDDPVISPVYPLKIGNKWTFKQTYLTNNGEVLGSDTVTQKIITEIMIDNEKWFLLKSTSFVDRLITARKDGIYVYYPGIKTAVLRYKYPAKMGEEYTSGHEEWTGSTDTLVTFQMKVDSTKETVTVPSGQYQCYKYHAPAVIATFGDTSTEVGGRDVLLSGVGPVKEKFGNTYWELSSTNFK